MDLIYLLFLIITAITVYTLRTEIIRIIARTAALVLLPVELEVFQISFVGETTDHLLSEFLQQRLCVRIQLRRRRRRRRTCFVWNDVEVGSRLRVGEVVSQPADGSHEAQA